jgi:hypothetical protein
MKPHLGKGGFIANEKVRDSSNKEFMAVRAPKA